MAPVSFRDDIYCYKIGQSIESIKAQQKELVANKDNKNPNGGKLRIGYYYNDGWMSSSEPIRRAIDKTIHVLTNDLGYECIKMKNMENKGLELIRMYLQFMGAEGNLENYVRALDGESLAGAYGYLRKASFTPNFLRQSIICPLLNAIGENHAAYLASFNKNGGMSVRELRELNLEIEKFRYEFFDEYKDCDLFLSPVCFYPAMPLNWSDKMATSVTGTMLQNLLDCASGSFGPVTYVRESECHYDKNVLNLPENLQRDSWQKLMNKFMKGAKGLPVNVQIWGKPWDDELVLRVMKELEVYIQPTLLDKEAEMQE